MGNLWTFLLHFITQAQSGHLLHFITQAQDGYLFHFNTQVANSLCVKDKT